VTIPKPLKTKKSDSVKVVEVDIDAMTMAAIVVALLVIPLLVTGFLGQ
jgi:hypothetical protein